MTSDIEKIEEFVKSKETETGNIVIKASDIMALIDAYKKLYEQIPDIIKCSENKIETHYTELFNRGFVHQAKLNNELDVSTIEMLNVVNTKLDIVMDHLNIKCPKIEFISKYKNLTKQID